MGERADFLITIMDEDVERIKKLRDILRRDFKRWRVEMAVNGQIILLEEMPTYPM